MNSQQPLDAEPTPVLDTPSPRRFQPSWRTLPLYVGSFFLALTFGFFCTFLFSQRAHTDRVGGNIYFAETPLHGLQEAGLKRVLAEHRQRLQAQVLEFHWPENQKLAGKTLKATAQDLGISLAEEELVTRALAAGKERSLFHQFFFWCNRLFSPYRLEAFLSVEKEKLEKKVQTWQEKWAPLPNTETRIFFKKTLQVEYPEPWIQIDAAQLAEQLPFWVSSPPEEPLVLPQIHHDPPISREELEARKQEAEALLSAPLNLVSSDGETQFSIPTAVLGKMLGSALLGEDKKQLVLTLDFAPLRKHLGSALSELEQPAVPAHFSVDKKHQVTVVPSQVGTQLDEKQLTEEIWAAVQRPERRVTLHFTEQQPEGLSTSEAESLGISGLVSTFVTHHPCCEPRVKNIHAVAQQIDGVVVRPGERFSLNEFLGPRTGQSGYLEAPTIVAGRMIPTVGGGISQFATTLFNAVLNGGYEMIQRQPHSFYFSRYPEGHEATVSFPSPDLVFRNDTKYGLLIKTEYSGTFIRISLYGNNEGRRVERKLSKRFAPTEPPVDYIANDKLPPNKTKLIHPGQKGWSVIATSIVHYPDGTKNEQNREVVYRPRPVTVEVHPCLIPKGLLGHTGEECPEVEDDDEDESDAED